MIRFNQIFILVLSLFITNNLIAQVDCDDLQKGPCCGVEPKPIPALSDLRCAEEKAKLYNMFPKLAAYKGYLFKEITKCSDKNLEMAPTELEFQYCLPNTREKFSITITDLNHPFYTTELGKSYKTLLTFPFETDAPIIGFFMSKNTILKSARIYIGTPTNKNGNHVLFDALYKKRFLIHIVIDDQKKFNSPDIIDSFLAEYIKQMNLE